MKVVYTYRPYEENLEFEDSNPMFQKEPLKGMVLIETFSGNPAKGGCQLSTCWERAGGKSERRDVLINPAHDFFQDDAYWAKIERRPPYAGQFAPECTTFSIAHPTPVIRKLDNPVGDQKNPELGFSTRIGGFRAPEPWNSSSSCNSA